MTLLQARNEFHAQLAASYSQQVQSTDLLDDGDLLTDDRDLDIDLPGMFIRIFLYAYTYI